MIFGHFNDPFERLPSGSVCRDHSSPTDKRDDPKEADKTGNIVDARENPPCQCHSLGIAGVHLTRSGPNYSTTKDGIIPRIKHAFQGCGRKSAEHPDQGIRISPRPAISKLLDQKSGPATERSGIPDRTFHTVRFHALGRP